jgi:predicted ATP-grasp superfamily ATP-dependent carboligase
VTPRRILLLDGESRQALAACRSLGSLGHHVEVAGHSAAALAAWSRFAQRYHRIPDSRGPTGPFAEAVDSLVEAHGHEVVVALEDPTVAQLPLLASGVAVCPRIGPPLDRLADKLGLADVATRAHVAYPLTAAWAEWAGGGAPEPPVFVKPSRSAAVHEGVVRSHSGARPAGDRAAAEELAGAIAALGLVPIVQERIVRSDKINVTIFRRAGRSEVRFPYRVLRDVPLSGGVAVTLETVPAAEGVGADAVAALERVCDAAGYEGVANGEFCVASAGGRLVLIEVNARLWGSLSFAERLGQGVAGRCVALALGLPSDPVEAPLAGPRRFHNLVGEVRWARLHGRRAPAAAAAVLSSVRPSDVYDYLDRRDPAAAFRYAAASARDRVRRRR